MNQMTQNRCGGVPVAHIHKHDNRLSRKHLGAMLLLLALMGFGGKAWGQVTWNGPISDNSGGGFIHYSTGTTITVTGHVQLNAPLLVWSGQNITIQTDGGGPYTISMTGSFSGINNSSFMIGVGWPGSVGALTINGGGKLIIDGGGNNLGSRMCFNILAGSSCTITGTTFQNGYFGSGGGAIRNEGTLACTDCTFGPGLVGAQGGAIYNPSGANLICNNCNFNGGLANRGGAIYNAGNANITGGSFNGNYTNTDNGGAIVNHGLGTLIITGATFKDNYTIENGGAIFNDSKIEPLSTAITSCTFIGNHAKVGGAIFNSTTMLITGTLALKSTFGDGTDANKNYAFQGGAIYNNGSSLDLSYCDFSVNKTVNSNGFPNGGDGGGAIYSTAGEASCTHSTFTGNEAFYDGTNAHGHGFGGAVNNRGTLFTFNDCTFSNNTAYVGGGICGFERVTVTECTFTGNKGTINGGGLYNNNDSESSPTVITSCEFYNNEAVQGGGIFSSGYIKITEDNNVPTLIHDNKIIAGQAGYGGGIYTNGIVDMEGGKIYNNTNNITHGGGVFVAVIPTQSGPTIGDFRLKGSSAIYSNTASSNGGGVYVEQANGTHGIFTMSGTSSIGTSGANSAANGGGIFSIGTVNLNGGVIENNTATTNGGGVYQDGTMNVQGVVVIENNTKSGAANNVFLNTSKLVTIAANGLDCGSHIGINNNTDELQITNSSGSDAVANTQKAFRNGFFFQDANSMSVATSSTGAFASNSSNLYLTSATIPQPCTFALATGAAAGTDYVATSGRVTQVLTLKGLAYLAKDVYLGNNYNGLTVTLANDITIGASDNWEPIGYRAYSDDCNGGTNKPFKGTFNGQGHSIINLRGSNVGYQDGGLFGYVEGGTIKNVIVASGNGVPATENVGGIVGYLNGGAVYNCMAAATTPTGGTNRGALVGKIANSGTVKNCYAISDAAAAGNGTVTNCYVRKATGGTASNMGTATNVGSGTTGTFTAVETTRPYSYNCFDNQVGSTPLLTLLNQWVDSQNNTPADLAHWTRATTSLINDDYPILMMPGHDAVASDGTTLHYGAVSGTGNLLSTYTSSSDAICLYNSVLTVASNSSSAAEFYINEDVAIKSGSGVNAHVGITLKDGAWHMFSPAIAAAPLGITYTDNTTDYGYNATLPQVSFNNDDGYFPKTNISGGDYYDSWDYYCYFEPQYHWINFKRNGNSHHHEDGNHEHIDYKATPSATVNVNETTLIPAKGYLLGTKLQTFLQSEGTLNDNNVSIALTSQSPLRTGYNFIGNPYQAYLDFDAFAKYTSNRGIWEGNEVTKASYVILESSGYMSYVHGASSNPFGADRYLHPHQGFMVVVKNGATSATFTNDMRSTTNTAAFRGDQVNYPLVNLIATEADGKRDITTVELGRPDQGGALKQYDLHLGKGSIYTHYGDDDYAIAFTQPGISEVGIRFETDEDATYTLSWDTENGEFSYLHLIDNITGIDTDCLTTSEYRFAAKTSDYKSRFKLVFGYTGVEENEDCASTGSATFAFLMGNELVVNCGPSTSSGTATLQMFDLMGRMMMERHVSGTQTSIMMPDLPAGVYVLRLSGNNGTRTQKIVME